MKCFHFQCDWSILSRWPQFNPLSPNIHIQILQTDLHTSSLRIRWENLINDHGIYSMIILLYSHNFVSWQCMEIVRKKIAVTHLIAIGT